MLMWFSLGYTHLCSPTFYCADAYNCEVFFSSDSIAYFRSVFAIFDHSFLETCSCFSFITFHKTFAFFVFLIYLAVLRVHLELVCKKGVWNCCLLWIANSAVLRFSCLTIFTWARLISGCFFGIPCLKCLRSAYIVFSFSKDVRRSSTVFIIPAHYLFLVVVHVYELFVGCGNVTIFSADRHSLGFVYWKWGCRGRPKTGWIIISSHQRINN